MAKADDKIPVWMPFAEALARAGSLEALLPVLIAGDATARAKDFLVNGCSRRRKDRTIPRTWWKLQDIESADLPIGRAKFRISLIDEITIPMTVIGIEIEKAPIITRWPTKPAKLPVSAPGKRPSPIWQLIFQHFDDEVTLVGRFPNLNSAATAVEAWLKEDESRAQLDFSTLKRGIKKHRPDWFDRANRA
jgi:hypothetical protein